MPIAGVFSDFKLIKTRSCAQIVIEVPIEQADEALVQLGGLPQPAKERWVAVAPLRQAPEPQPGPEETIRTPTPFRDLSPTKQAVIKCSDANFRAWAKRNGGLQSDSEEEVSSWVKLICQVESRTELLLDAAAAARWRKLLGSYEDDRLGRH